MTGPIVNKKIQKDFFIKIYFFLLCDKSQVRFHEIDGNTVS